MRREMYGIPDEACKEKEREVTFIGGAGINAPLFSGRSFHQRYLAPAGRVVRRQHIPAHLPRLFDALGQMEDRPPAILGVDRIERFRQAVILFLAGAVGKEVDLSVRI